MHIEALSIEGAYVVTPRQFPDQRGVFLESFRGDRLAEHLGHRPDIVQTNVSVSARGTVRGIHFADVPPGQGKYVTVLAGSLLDYVVDICDVFFRTGRLVDAEDNLRRVLELDANRHEVTVTTVRGGTVTSRG